MVADHEAATRSSSARRTSTATLLTAGISAGLLWLLYRSVDVRLVLSALRNTSPTWLVVSVGMIVPITLLRAFRFYWVVPPAAGASGAESLRLTLVASALNVFMPAKAGDLIKSYFVARRSTVPTEVALAIVVYERLCDLFGMIAWCLLGWFAGPERGHGLPPLVWLMLTAVGGLSWLFIASERAAELLVMGVHRTLPHRRLARIRQLCDGLPLLLRALRGRRRWIIVYSLGLWLAHLTQIWLFTVALNTTVPFLVCASLSAIALLVGQIPITVAGIGTRDVALVVLLGDFMPRETAAAMGVLVSTRGLLPPLMGLPIMKPYLAHALDEARRWRKGVRPR